MKAKRKPTYPPLRPLADQYRPKERPVFESEPVNLPPAQTMYGNPKDSSWLFFKAPYDVVDRYRKGNLATDLGNKKFDATYTREIRNAKRRAQ